MCFGQVYLCNNRVYWACREKLIMKRGESSVSMLICICIEEKTSSIFSRQRNSYRVRWFSLQCLSERFFYANRRRPSERTCSLTEGVIYIRLKGHVNDRKIGFYLVNRFLLNGRTEIESNFDFWISIAQVDISKRWREINHQDKSYRRMIEPLIDRA